LDNEVRTCPAQTVALRGRSGGSRGPAESGCRIDGDRPPAARPSGGTSRPGIEPGALA